MADDIITLSLYAFHISKMSYKIFKKKHACVENIQVQGKTNSTYQLRVVNVRWRIMWPANCQSLSNWQRMLKSHNHKKNHKLIKPSFHPLARWLRREFLLFFIDMRGSYVVCVISRKSSLCVVGTYINIERIHLVSHPTAAADLNASFTLLVPKELSRWPNRLHLCLL